jgi:NAD-dependent SIR2 family protein deacetylase
MSRSQDKEQSTRRAIDDAVLPWLGGRQSPHDQHNETWPGVVWLNEALPDGSWKAAVQAVEGCDLLLVIGTSGLVHPAADLPGLAKARGAFVVEVNPVETALSDVPMGLSG